MSERSAERSLRLYLLGCLTMLGCSTAEDDPLRILEAQRPLMTQRVNVGEVRSEDGPIESLQLPPEGRQKIELDVQGGEWGLGKQASVIYTGTKEYRPKPVPPSSNDRMLHFQGAVHRADGPHRTKEVQQVPVMFRFNDQGTGGVLQAFLEAPKEPGRYALEVLAIDTEAAPESSADGPADPASRVAPLWRTSLTVVAED